MTEKKEGWEGVVGGFWGGVVSIGCEGLWVESDAGQSVVAGPSSAVRGRTPCVLGDGKVRDDDVLTDRTTSVLRT